ncbi:MAG TPA: beta-galactosidase, partial [Gemmatimonadales bacterium]|nr:beta-galactosidase [Gemmatimonadales bacterium]
MRDAVSPRSLRCALALLLAACAPSPAPAPASPGFKPLSFAVLEDYDKGASLDSVARDFALMRELGVPAWRGSFGWDDYEPDPGRYDFAWLDRFATLADTMGIELHPYLGYTPAWAAAGGRDDQAWNDPPRSPEAWTAFAGALGGELGDHPSLRSWEIYNEENVPLWWDGSAEEYAEVLRGGAEALRKADPGTRILLGGMVWPDLEWLETACARGASFDVLPFHAYPETWTPESVTVERYLGPRFAEDFVAEADRMCGRRPIWINETGFATVPGTTEAEQAAWWARAFATFLAAPRIEHLGIYELRDQRLDTPVIGDAPNYYLGLLRRDGTRKPAFETVKLLVRLFGRDSIAPDDGALRVEAASGAAGELHHHLFIRPDGRRLAFVWDRRAAPTVRLTTERP